MAAYEKTNHTVHNAIITIVLQAWSNQKLWWLKKLHGSLEGLKKLKNSSHKNFWLLPKVYNKKISSSHLEYSILRWFCFLAFIFAWQSKACHLWTQNCKTLVLLLENISRLKKLNSSLKILCEMNWRRKKERLWMCYTHHTLLIMMPSLYCIVANITLFVK